jgi:cysteine desulfurase family protein
MGQDKIIYLDHAATSWPKPESVAMAVAEAIINYGANPGRGAHQLAVKASRVIMETRFMLAKLLNVKNPNDIAFTSNTTAALNMVINGYLNKGDHVIYSGIEHNSVRRPLEALQEAGIISITQMTMDEIGQVDLGEFEKQLKINQTKLVIVNHASNLLGTILPIEQIIDIAHEYGATVLVDVAQTIGVLPIDVKKLNADFIAFPGHKGLLGPQGTGGVYISPLIDLKPTILGGTGSQSEKKEQPTVRPDRYESGTLNTPGIAGLNESLKYIMKQDLRVLHENEWRLTQVLIKELCAIEGIHILGPKLGEDRVGIVSFVINKMDSAKLAFELDRQFGIAVRSGYHCTPLAHTCAGTLETGAVRISVGWNTTEAEVRSCVSAINQLINK